MSTMVTLLGADSLLTRFKDSSRSSIRIGSPSSTTTANCTVSRTLSGAPAAKRSRSNSNPGSYDCSLDTSSMTSSQSLTIARAEPLRIDFSRVIIALPVCVSGMGPLEARTDTKTFVYWNASPGKVTPRQYSLAGSGSPGGRTSTMDSDIRTTFKDGSFRSRESKQPPRRKSAIEDALGAFQSMARLGNCTSARAPSSLASRQHLAMP
mmetsp:Transcript_9254/g.31716  ORF Transcript_9254/g.31716 Transcript_9254/m.31716 type:complete len:208 (-) Transcript_9254:1244-1867(-)